MNKLILSLIFCFGLSGLSAQLGNVTLVSPDPIPDPLLNGVAYNFIFEYEYLPGGSANVVDLSTVTSSAVTGSAIFGTPVTVGSFVSIEITPTSGDLAFAVSMDDDDAGSISSIGSYVSEPLTVPVEFGEIKYEERENDILISWTTYSEQNSNFFDLERSYDGLDFVSVQSVSGAGRSAEVLNYSVLDEAIEGNQERLFYRIKQVDIDGKVEYSDVLKVVKRGTDTNFEITNFRNNGNLSLVISSAKEQSADYVIFTISGKLIAQGNIEMTKGQNFVTADVANFSGIAVVSISDGNVIVSKKIVL